MRPSFTEVTIHFIGFLMRGIEKSSDTIVHVVTRRPR